jgi:hypothetical protein
MGSRSNKKRHQQARAEINKHGLTRDIPDPVKREVRQRCRFGCVVCGGLPIQYEHFDPPFPDARTHDPLGITILCASCHDKKTRRFWSADLIRRANRKPFGLTRKSHVLLDFSEPEILVVGTVVMLGRGPLLVVEGQELLGLHYHENEGGLLSARLYDLEGRECVIVQDNELLVAPENWDIQLVGPLFTAKNARRETILEMRFYPPRNVHIRALQMAVQGWLFDLRPNGQVFITSPAGGGMRLSETVIVAGGRWHFQDGTHSLEGGACINPRYPLDRFTTLLEAGALEVLVQEITEH